jgi:hypothetical protein
MKCSPVDLRPPVATMIARPASELPDEQHDERSRSSRSWTAGDTWPSIASTAGSSCDPGGTGG